MPNNRDYKPDDAVIERIFLERFGVDFEYAKKKIRYYIRNDVVNKQVRNLLSTPFYEGFTCGIKNSKPINSYSSMAHDAYNTGFAEGLGFRHGFTSQTAIIKMPEMDLEAYKKGLDAGKKEFNDTCGKKD